MKKLSIVLLGILFSTVLFAQEEKEEFDPSKKTNLYSSVAPQLEVTIADDYNMYGERTVIRYAFNSDNMALIEVPFAYNDATEKTGLTDMRVRYFWAAKRNISKNVIAVVPYADVSMPTGCYEDGLGSDTWSLGLGSIVGIVINQKLSLFPGLNLVYTTKSEEFGVGWQTNLTYKFNKETFASINPLITFTEDDTVWAGEFSLNHMLTPTLKANIGWFPNFTNETDSFRAGVTFYF